MSAVMPAWVMPAELVVLGGIFSGAAMLVALVLLVYLGRREGLGALACLELYGWLGVGSVGGARLAWWLLPGLQGRAMVPLGEFLQFWSPGYSSVGALAGGAVAVLAWTKLTSTGKWAAVLDAVVPAGLASLAVARMGCLFRGCDFGRPLESPWPLELAYGRQSLAFAAQLARGEVGWQDAQCLAVFPLAGVLSLGTLVWLALVCWRIPAGSGGQRAWWAALGYLVWRSVWEFWRDPAANVMLVGGVSAFHAAAACALVLMWAMRRHAGPLASTARGGKS